MSIFYRCDRCGKAGVPSGAKMEPTGWEVIKLKELCKECVKLVDDLLRTVPASQLQIRP